MTTIVYTEEVMSADSPSSANVTRFLVEIGMGETQSSSVTSRSTNSTTTATATTGVTTGSGSGGHLHRPGSPKPKSRFSVKKRSDSKLSSYPTGYPAGFNPRAFTITAYLPNDGGRRLKLHCTPGQTVQQVIESEMPEIVHSGYQVYQFPSRALLNPEKEASVLQDQEISIEPMRQTSPDDTGDERLLVAKELLRTEDTYLENLRNIFDIYMEPLKKWGLPQSEMNTMFRSLSRLCDLLMNFFSELEMAVQFWNTRSTPIGGLFKQYRSFWDMYKEYSLNYAKACKLLKDKRVSDESFNRFLELKRGAAMHTLESLMLLPVQRIHEYHKLLLRLFQLTPDDHPDHCDLRYTITCVESIVQDREQQLNQSENEIKLDKVQQRFPNDNLNLDQPIDVIEQQSKRYKGYAGTPGSSSGRLKTRKLGSLEHTDGSPVERRRVGVRLYVNEGPVKIVSLGMQSHDRHLFLFNDMLIIAKPIGRQSSKTQKFFKRKEQLRLSEMWVSENLTDVVDASLPLDTSFILGWPGWPIVNYVAVFSSPEERKLWFTLLSKHISAQRQTVSPEKVSIQIVNLTKSSNNIPIWMQVHSSETTNHVLSRALEQLAIAVANSNCQMWVKFSKEGAGLQLLGHEHPFAIQNFHNRHQVDYLGDGKPVQLQIVIKRKTPNPPLKKGRSGLLKWPRNKRQTTKDSPRYKVFKAPLHMVIANEQLPEILQEILVRLYDEGPHTFGIFRQSANHKKVKEYKETIDNRAPVDLSDESIHVLGALLKDFLRSVPGGILMSSRYTEFVATNDITDIHARVQHIQRVINRLPRENQLFLQYLMPLLYRISRFAEINCMNSINLAICFAPSLLWPDSGLDVIKNEVPPLVQFMVEHCPKIFGEELPALYKQMDLPISPGVERMDIVSDKSPTKHLVPTKIEDGTQFEHKRSDSLDSSMSEGSAAEDMEESNLLRTRGLTYSDSQLSQISQLDEYDIQPPRSREFMEIRISHKHPRAGFSIGMPHRPELEKPQAKRIKKLQQRKPERTSSLHGTTDSPYLASARLKYRKSKERAEPSTVRRKSIATQTTLPRKMEHFVQQLAPIPQSSSSSLTSSSQGGYSPQIMTRTTTLGERSYPSPQRQPPPVYHSYLPHEEASPRHVVDKKRRLPQYSHSFSNRTENKPNKPLPSSNSFYDRLLPLETTGNGGVNGGLRSQFAGEEEQGKAPTLWRISDSTSQGQGTRQLGTPLASSSLATHSNQSISSSRSGSSTGSQGIHYLSRPSNSSLVSSQSGGSGGRGSPGSAEVPSFRKPDRVHVKDMISNRFNIQPDYPPPSSSSSAQAKPVTRRLGTSYQQPEPMQLQQPQQEHAVYQKSEGEDSLERIRQKMSGRKRLDATLSSDQSFIKSPSYQSFLSSHQKKDSLKSLTEEVSHIDDRPESEQHLNSLPRPHTAEFVRQEKPSSHPILHHHHHVGTSPYTRGAVTLPVGAVLETVHDQDPNKLAVGSGYNSDTESSPSRTLNRAGKLNEVTTPTKTTMPHRYRGGSLNYGSSTGGGGSGSGREYQQKSRQQHYQDMYLQSKTIGQSGSLPSSSASPSTQPQQVQKQPSSSPSPVNGPEGGIGRRTLSANGRNEEAIASLVSDFNASSKASLNSRRPKSGDISTRSMQQSTSDKFKNRPLEKTNSNIEDAKIKLGLIPSPRQRSKSTSEKEAMKVIHKIIEEEEGAGRASQEEERAEKHKEWLSSAPTSAERRKAWESYSTKQQPQFQRSDGRTRSFRNEGSSSAVIDKPPPPAASFIKPSITPELKRKSATMPDYLVTGSSRYPALRGSHVRTVKVVSYEVPEAKKVRKINLRTYH